MPRKAKKNAQGAGTIRKRSDGRWKARYTIGFDPVTGKQKQKSIYGKTQKEVRERLAEITVQLDQKTYEEPVKMLLGEWLDIWLSEYLGNTKLHTRKSYEATIENHIKPALGKSQLQALTPVMVQQFINHLENRKGKSKRLNPKTVKNVHGVLHSALQQAVRIGYLKTNPASLTILPKRGKAEITPLQDEQVVQFLQAIKGQSAFIWWTCLLASVRARYWG